MRHHRRPLSFGALIHAVLAAFTRERRGRAARGEPAPTKDDLVRLLGEYWAAEESAGLLDQAKYPARAASLIDQSWVDNSARPSTVIAATPLAR